jgi:hypothetical protein
MRALIDDLHSHGQHYVMITDPGISSTQQRGSYPPLDQGISNDVFINVSGKPLIGKVWPGEFVLWSEILRQSDKAFPYPQCLPFAFAFILFSSWSLLILFLISVRVL